MSQFSTPVSIGTLSTAVSSTDSIITLSGAAPLGALVVTMWFHAGTAGVQTGVSDSRGNTYSAPLTRTNGLDNVGFSYSVIGTALQVSDTITATSGTAAQPRAGLAMYVTGSTASPLDQTVLNFASSTQTSTTATSSTLAQADELVVVCFGAGNTATITPTSIAGYTQFSDLAPGTNRCLATGWKIVSATSGVSAACTWNAVENNTGWILATFKAQADPGTVYLPLLLSGE